MRSTVIGTQTEILNGKYVTGFVIHGGPGSGDYDHPGRPGERGGSSPGQGGPMGPAAKESLGGKEAAGKDVLGKAKSEAEELKKESERGEHGEHFGEEEEHEPTGTVAVEVWHKTKDLLNVLTHAPEAIGGALKSLFGTEKVASHVIEQHASQVGHTIAHHLHGGMRGALNPALKGVAGAGAGAGAKGAEEIKHANDAQRAIKAGIEHEEHSGEHGEGEHHGAEGSEHVESAESAWNAIGEAIGTVVGANVAGFLNKWSGLQKMHDDLYEHMKEEYGAAAPYMHSLATGASIIVKTALSKSLSMALGGANVGTVAGGLSGMYAGYARGKTQGRGVIGKTASALGYGMLGAGIGTGLGYAAPHLEEISEHLGEEGLAGKILGASTEGIKGLGGFMSPGVALASLWTLHMLGHALITKTGIGSSHRAKALGDWHRRTAERPTVKAAQKTLEKLGKHIGFITKGRLPSEWKEIKKDYGTAKAGVKGVIGKATSHFTNPPESPARLTPDVQTRLGYTGNSFIGNAPSFGGSASDTTARSTPDVVGQQAPPDWLNDPAQEKMQAIQSLDLDNPGIQMYVQLLRRAIIALMQTDLWKKINTPLGAHTVLALMGDPNAEQSPEANDERTNQE